MAIRIMPEARIEPVRSQTGGAGGRVEPLRDASGASMIAVGEGMQDLGRSLTVWADREQDKVDVGMSARGEVLFRESYRELFEGPGGFLSTLGVDAVGDRNGSGPADVGSRRKRAFEQLRTKRQSIEKTLTNEAQRLNFMQLANDIEGKAALAADRHQAEQASVLAAGHSKQRMVDLLREGADAETPDEFEVAKTLLLAESDSRAAFLGMTPAQTNGMRRDATTALYQDRAARLIAAGRWQQAGAEIDEHEQEIESGSLAVLRRHVQAAATDDAAAHIGIALREQPLLDAVAVVDRAFSEGLMPVEIRNAAIAELRKADDMRDTERAQGAKLFEDQAQTFAQLNGVREYDGLPSPLRVALERAGIADRTKLWFKQGNQWVTSGLGRRALLEFDNDDWQRFGSEAQVLDGLRAHLSDTDMPKAIAAWREATGKGDAKTADAKLRDLILTNTAREAGILPPSGKASDEQAAHLSRFEEAVLRLAQHESKDGKVSAELLRKVARSVAFDTVTLPGGTKVPFATATREQQTSAYVDTQQGRRVFNRSLDENTKAQILEAIDVYNAEAQKRNATRPPDQQIPIKPRTMEQVANEWDRKDRVRISTTLAEVKDARSRLAIEKGLKQAKLLSGGDPAKAVEWVRRWNDNPNQRAYAALYSGLTPEDLQELLRIVEAEAVQAAGGR